MPPVVGPEGLSCWIKSMCHPSRRPQNNLWTSSSTMKGFHSLTRPSPWSIECCLSNSNGIYSCQVSHRGETLLPSQWKRLSYRAVVKTISSYADTKFMSNCGLHFNELQSADRLILEDRDCSEWPSLSRGLISFISTTKP